MCCWLPRVWRVFLPLFFFKRLCIGSQAENAALRANIARLENARTSAGGSPDAYTTPSSCPGSQLIDTCWFKVCICSALNLRSRSDRQRYGCSGVARPSYAQNRTE